MTAIKVEKNVPIPPQMRPRSSAIPFEKMEIGDSIFIPCKDKKAKGRATSSVAMYAKKHGVKFTTRTVTGGIRVWLITMSALAAEAA